MHESLFGKSLKESTRFKLHASQLQRYVHFLQRIVLFSNW